uniref:Uncharacterized protein n=1 Tax=Clytia hemisphaerica TaxID=252671 RepID=A0A7M5V0M9_9CNID
MTLSQFTILGLTQPDSAIALMKDENGQRSGFPFRFIWYFPEPKFSSLADLLSPDPIDQEVFESALVKYLTLKYERSDENCTYTTEDKVLSVRPTLEQYTLSPTALEMFREFHDHVELGILKKYLFNLIISGAYSKAKGMALRVALVVQHLLNFINEYKQNTKDHGGENSREAPSEMSDADDNEIGVDALNIAISIVQLSLNQTCLINFGDMLGNANSIPTNLQYSLDIELMRKLLLINSSIISMSVLINDHFARPNIKTINKKAVETEGAALMRVFRKLNDLKLGRFVQLKGSKNHRPVYFFKKKENVCEETKNENLENLGISAEDFAAHEEAHEQLNDDEEEHRKAYVAKEKWVESDFTPEDIIQATPSTPKKRKNSGGDPIAEKKKHVEDSEDKD